MFAEHSRRLFTNRWAKSIQYTIYTYICIYTYIYVYMCVYITNGYIYKYTYIPLFIEIFKTHLNNFHD